MSSIIVLLVFVILLVLLLRVFFIAVALAAFGIVAVFVLVGFIIVQSSHHEIKALDRVSFKLDNLDPLIGKRCVDVWQPGCCMRKVEQGQEWINDVCGQMRGRMVDAAWLKGMHEHGWQ